MRELLQGGGLTALAKERLQSPQCVTSTAQVFFLSTVETQLTLPQPVTNASICKMTVRNA